MTTGVLASMTAAPDIPQAQPKKIGDAAKQFEGMMIGQMLKSAREAGADEDEDQDSQGMLDLADQQFAQVMANNGGIGLAQLAVTGINKGETSAHR